MTVPVTAPTTAAPPARAAIHGRQAGFISDVVAVAGRAVRAIPRKPAAVVPFLVIPVFFFVVNTGSLQNVARGLGPGFDIKAFQLPVAIIFAVTGSSRASTLVTDIQSGYFDRLLVTPVHRLALLLGLMVADFTLVAALTVPIIVLALVVGVRFATGLAGMAAFIVLAASWGLAFTGFPYAIALKTGNPAAVSASHVIFFPFAFLTTAYLPRAALTGWLSTIARYNPVTYVLDGLRSLVSSGWDLGSLAGGVGAVGLTAAVSMTLALLALRGRVTVR